MVVGGIFIGHVVSLAVGGCRFSRFPSFKDGI